MKKVPEQYRLRKHPVLASDASYGNNGFFVIPHPRIANYSINCMVSDGGGVAPWEHVSVTLSSTDRKVERCPTWEEMCFVKEMFWNDDEAVMQLHPPRSEYVNNHKYCLHLWKPIGIEIPLPDSLMVGFKSEPS
jgi:hypothetical protein